MARLAAVEKGEYYPTPLTIVDTIAQAIDIQEGRGVIRLFDPCAGEGLALEHLAALLRHKAGRPVETWGVEISPDRARQATTRLDTVVEAPFEATTWSPSAIKAPVSLAWTNPPYDENGDGGRLELDFFRRVTEWLGDGGILALIVPWQQVGWPMCSDLAAGYSDVEVFRFPDATGPEGFDAFGQVVVLARRDTGKVAVGYTYEEAQEIYSLFHPSSGHPIDAVRALPTSPNGHRYTVQPVGVTPRLRRNSYTWEEIALACRGGFPDVAQRLLPDNAEMDDPLRKLKVGHIAQVVAAGLVGTLVARDKVFKGRAIKTQVAIQDPVDPTRETVKDVYETHISCVTPQGYTHLAAPHQVARFLKEHADLFRQHVEAQFHPYGTDVQERERAILDTLSLDKQLPGRDQVGLFEDQKLSAVALTRSIARYGVAHLVAQMGYGKSRTSLATVELMGAYPALVCCPPHLVEDWVEEAEGAVPGLKAVIVESISELEGVVESYRPGDRLAVIVSHSRIKMGPGWTPAYNEKTLFVPHKKDKNRLVAKKVPVCPGCGKPLVDGSHIQGRASLEQKPLTCHHTVPAWDDVEKAWVERPCATPLYQFSPTIARRWPLADYIAKKLPRFFRVLIFDEVHKGKAKDTDIARAFQVLARILPTITLTGTFFGGLSTSIFYLLYRTQANVRTEFGFDDERRWAERFGVLETVYKTEEDEFGVLNARKRRRLSTKEQPGLSPEAIRFMLSTTVFAKVADLGMEMPACVEDLVPIELGPLNGHIGAFGAWTWDKMVEHWPRWTSAWLQWNLARPNSAFREEVVQAPDGELLCPAQVGDGELLPKEAWLVNLVKSELAQGRKVIVYPRQTGTRDIRARLQAILAAGGVTDIAVLGANVGTRKRKRWLEANARPVLITNPKLVETGVNLHAHGYSTIVFFEIEYSLYVLWQAMSRVWRPGQTRKVKIFFSHYAGTLEEKALSRMGRKMMAGQLLYGEDVTSALVEDTGDASLVLDLIRAIQDEEELVIRPDTQIFGTMGSDTVTDSPMGSPTMRSRSLTTTEQWLRDHGLTLADAKPRGSRRKKPDVPEGQLSFLEALPKVA